MIFAMKIRLIQVGKTKDSYLEPGILEFCKRLNEFCDLEILTLKDNEKVLKSLKDQEFVVTLDEKGKELSSEGFAKVLGAWQDEGQHLCFVIGDAFGIGDEVKKRANFSLSLSKMTFTHQMVRLFFLEQLYRAFSIVKGKKYHHA